jgi:hypothetical protein
MTNEEAHAINMAQRAMGTLSLDGMTHERWQLLTNGEREKLRDKSDLTPQLVNYEYWRVEVVDNPGDRPRRFWVSRSTGWRPVHIEIKRRNSHGGEPCAKRYHCVRYLPPHQFGYLHTGVNASH